jgi:hypothetical protein
MERGTIFFSCTKAGNPWTVELHPQVEAMPRSMWLERGRPDGGMSSSTGEDNPTGARDLKVQGGNPL